MFEPYLMGQYQYPWQGMTPAPNWQPQTPQVAQGQQGWLRRQRWRADAEPRSKLLPSIFGSLGRRGHKSSLPGVKGAHNGC